MLASLVRTCLRAGTAAFLLASLPQATAPAAPAIELVTPAGWCRGGEVEVVLAGRELADPAELFFEEGRIEVLGVQGINPTRMKARVRIPADCPPGSHRLRVRTAAGLSDLRTFRVGTLPCIVEKDPNDDPADAQRVDPEGTTVAGTIRPEDVDCFVVTVRAGERIAAVVDGMRLDQELFDPAVEILAPDGTVVASGDDHPLLAQDALAACTAAVDGDHVVRVREAGYGGTDGSVYLLHVGRFPVAHVASPPGGAPAATLEVEWLGDPGGPFRETLPLPASGNVDGLVEVRPTRDGRTAPFGVPIRLTTLPAATETEPNGAPEKATRASAPVALQGSFGHPDDVDWLRVEAPKGSTWSVRGWSRRIGSPADMVLAAHRDTPRRERIAQNDDADGPDSALDVTVPDEGTFLLRLADHRGRGGPGFVWQVEVAPARPGITLSVPPGRNNSQERLVAAVPRGNRTALVFNNARRDVPGDCRSVVRDLPPGVQATAGISRAGAPGQVVVFEAAADAPPGTSTIGADVFLLGAGGGTEGDSLGGIRQVTSLIFGFPNQTVYRTSTSDRIPVAVVDPVPVSIEVDPPRTPLVPRGALDLVVRVRRGAGAPDKLRLGFPFKPPGIGAATDVDVADGAEEVRFPLNAAADAAKQSWTVVVTAAERRGAGMATVSSRPFTLRVVEPALEVAATKAVVVRGGESRFVCTVTRPGSFQGTAVATLKGLPAGVTSDPVSFDAAAERIDFPLRVAADAPLGKHDNVFCRIEVPMEGGLVTHSSTAAGLRVDDAGTTTKQAVSRREQLREQARALAAGEAGSAVATVPGDAAGPEDPAGAAPAAADPSPPNP